MPVYPEISARTLLTNAWDAEGDTITVRRINGTVVTTWPHVLALPIGQVNITENGEVTYETANSAGHPGAGETAQNGSFSFTLWDGLAESDTYLVNVQLRAEGVAANAEATLAFAGPDLLQVILMDGAITRFEAEIVADTSLRIWSPDPADRNGGAGSYGGVDGNFSGDLHQSAPQMFTPWPEYADTTHSATFAADFFGNVPADDPANWAVTVGGTAGTITDTWRKTVPVGSAKTGSFTYESVARHVVTLKLAAPVADGEVVNVTLPSGGTVSADYRRSRLSEAVHVCQEGYPTSGPKKGYVGLWLGQDANGANGSTDAALSTATGWALVRTIDGSEVAAGSLVLAKPGAEIHQSSLNFNGCDIYEADFSAVTEEGSYRLEVEGVGSSFGFPIAPNPYAEAFRLALRWYYNQRSGTALVEPFAEGHTRHRNAHPADGLTVYQTDVPLGRYSEGFTGPSVFPVLRALDPASLPANADAWGGWHDAGDWDRRIQHMDAVYTMAEIVELLPTARTLSANLPESGKTFADPGVAARKGAADAGDGATVLPDLIHEALWGLSLWRRTQGAGGEILGGVEYTLDGIGGSVSWNHVQTAFAYGPEEWAAYQFARGAAKLGHVIKNVVGDAALGDDLIAEAEAAWDWAEATLGTGIDSHNVYNDTSMARVRIAAAATLFRATGRADVGLVFESYNAYNPQDAEGNLGTNRGNYTHEAWDYVRAGNEGRSVNASVSTSIVNWMTARFNADTGAEIGNDYGLHNTTLYPYGTGWTRFGPGSNWRARRILFDILATGSFTPVAKAVVLEGMWFALGCNPSNVSLIQGLGTRAFADPFAADHDYGIPGQPAFGPAAGSLRSFERDGTAGSIYPEDDTIWPRYARIFEASRVILSAEHGMKANAMEWLLATALAHEALEGTL